MRIYKLKFRSALHVDEKGSGSSETASEFIRSDTISAAASIAWAKLFKEDRDRIFSDPPFRVSSAFPYIGDILFFPVPVWSIWQQAGDAERRKEVKKVKWISRELFQKVLKNEQLSIDDCKIISCGVAVTKEELFINKGISEYTAPWKITERQRVAVDRLNSDPSNDETQGSLFFFAMQFFSEESGLYFIADGEDKKLSRLECVLDFLGDEGIGADRNSGLGSFFVKKADAFSINLPKKADGWMSLSLFNPKADENLEQLLKSTAYNLVTRTGWISGTTYGRAPVKAFTECSYFSGKPEGRILSVLSKETKSMMPHDVYRDLRTIALPCVKPDI